MGGHHCRFLSSQKFGDQDPRTTGGGRAERAGEQEPEPDGDEQEVQEGRRITECHISSSHCRSLWWWVPSDSADILLGFVTILPEIQKICFYEPQTQHRVGGWALVGRGRVS